MSSCWFFIGWVDQLPEVFCGRGLNSATQLIRNYIILYTHYTGFTIKGAVGWVYPLFFKEFWGTTATSSEVVIWRCSSVMTLGARDGCACAIWNTAGGRSPAFTSEVGSLSHDLQGFIHPRCCFGFLPSTVDPSRKNGHWIYRKLQSWWTVLAFRKL